MTSTLLRRLGWPLLGSVVALGLATPASAAEELRIGFVAPTTGLFAQVGKDMVDGFQLYLDDVNSDFGGAKVKFIVEDEQAKPDTAVTRAKKLICRTRCICSLAAFWRRAATRWRRSAPQTKQTTSCPLRRLTVLP